MLARAFVSATPPHSEHLKKRARPNKLLLNACANEIDIKPQDLNELQLLQGQRSRLGLAFTYL